MRIVFFLCALSYSFGINGCELSREVVSLSGPITMLFEELDLLKDKKLIAISKFHPVLSPGDVTVVAGGTFLAKKMLRQFTNRVIYFDKSQELSLIFKKSKIKRSIEIDTRGLDPFETVDNNLRAIGPVIKNCSKKIKLLKANIQKIQKELQLPVILHHAIFYLGSIADKAPNLIIGRDGFVLSLLKVSHFKTYPTELAYVPWSQKVLLGLYDYTHVGIKNVYSNEFIVKKVKNKFYNISFRGVLIPGIRQVYFLKSLTSFKDNND